MCSNPESTSEQGAVVLAKNERKTENIVRDKLRDLGFYDKDNDVHVEEQKSNIEGVKRLLRAASKSGGGGGGAPEFIISAPSSPDFLLIIECKASVNDHSSDKVDNLLDGTPIAETDAERVKRIQRYAVDGVLHYSRPLDRVLPKSGNPRRRKCVAKGGSRRRVVCGSIHGNGLRND